MKSKRNIWIGKTRFSFHFISFHEFHRPLRSKSSRRSLLSRPVWIVPIVRASLNFVCSNISCKISRDGIWMDNTIDPNGYPIFSFLLLSFSRTRKKFKLAGTNWSRPCMLVRRWRPSVSWLRTSIGEPKKKTTQKPKNDKALLLRPKYFSRLFLHCQSVILKNAVILNCHCVQ